MIEIENIFLFIYYTIGEEFKIYCCLDNLTRRIEIPTRPHRPLTTKQGTSLTLQSNQIINVEWNKTCIA